MKDQNDEILRISLEGIKNKLMQNEKDTVEDAENGLRRVINSRISMDEINNKLSNLKEDRENSAGNISFNRSLENVFSSIDNLLFQFDVFISLDTEKEDNKYLFEAYRNIKNDLLGMKSFIYARKFKVDNPNCFKKI